MAICHTRLRLQHNSLNHNLHRLGVTDSASCACGFTDETEAHYLLYCPQYEQAKQNLFLSITRLIPHIYPTVQSLKDDRPSSILRLLLHGSNTLSNSLNEKIFAEMHAYIQSTNHFFLF